LDHECVRCQLSGCPESCPYARERETIFECAECGEPVCDGDEYYRINGDVYCRYCVDEMRFTA
jgi:formylmethanofuran dehydrogenase subunit E